jgi:hypothetical protein
LMEDVVVALTAYARSSVEHYKTLLCFFKLKDGPLLPCVWTSSERLSGTVSMVVTT